MAISTNALLFGLTDAKLYPLLTDVPSASGGATYSAAIDILGASELKLTPIVESKQQTGDGSILATATRVMGADVEITAAYLPLASLQYILGGSVTASGTTPNQKQSYSLTTANASPGYFKIEGIWNPGETDYANCKLTAYKIKVTDAPEISVSDANGDYGDVVIKGKLVALSSTGKFFDIDINETAATCSA